MIKSVGCDIEENARFENKSQAFLDKVYTKAEQEYSLAKAYPAEHLAVRWCAKEAVVKALYAIGITGIHYKDIEVVLNELNVPGIKISGHEGLRFYISLAHSKHYAIAQVLCEKD